MRACSTGVFGSCLLLCAPTIGVVRGGGIKNCAPPLESEHESRPLKNSADWRGLSPARTGSEIMAIADVGLDDPPAAVELAVRSCRRRQQLRQPRQIVGGGGEAEGPSDAIAS